MTGTEIEPRMHDGAEVGHDIRSGRFDSIAVKETIAALASNGMWGSLWNIADAMSREVSVLFDAEGRIWVDVGTAGKVRLAPPEGSMIPYRMWIHTHPWDAYWSATDLGTLAAHSSILKQALVLGHDHLKHSGRPSERAPTVIEPDGPLSQWTSEPNVTYAELEAGHAD